MPDVVRLLDTEQQFATQASTALGEATSMADRLIAFCWAITDSDPTVDHPAKVSLIRLHLDAAVAVEQSILACFRAQVRVAWAVLRNASEALKDLDVIERKRELHPLWLAANSKTSTLDEISAALSAFSDARLSVKKSKVTELCQKTMGWCSLLGAHPNSTSLTTSGPVIKLGQNLVSFPKRTTDIPTLRFHLRLLIFHAAPIVTNLADFRLRYLPKGAREPLQGARAAFDEAIVPFVKAVQAEHSSGS